ncbi:hypothetical protein NPIL_593891, partial [Nephila pilipes]
MNEENVATLQAFNRNTYNESFNGEEVKKPDSLLSDEAFDGKVMSP